MFHTYVESLFLAQLLGLYVLVLSVIFLSRAEHYRAIILNACEDNYFHVLSRSMSLLLGLFLVLIHNIWVFHPRVLVTIGCWIFLLKAILWLAAPEKMLYFLRRLCAGKGCYYIAIGWALIGVLFITRGLHLFWIKVHSIVVT